MTNEEIIKRLPERVALKRQHAASLLQIARLQRACAVLDALNHELSQVTHVYAGIALHVGQPSANSFQVRRCDDGPATACVWLNCHDNKTWRMAAESDSDYKRDIYDFTSQRAALRAAKNWVAKGQRPRGQAAGAKP